MKFLAFLWLFYWPIIVIASSESASSDSASSITTQIDEYDPTNNLEFSSSEPTGFGGESESESDNDNDDDEIYIPNSVDPASSSVVQERKNFENFENFENAESAESSFDVQNDEESFSLMSKTSETAHSEKESFSFFPHTVGIKNHALNCYASSLIACLYNIPLFHAVLFDTLKTDLKKEEPVLKRTSLTAALSTIFFKMRYKKWTVNLDTFFASALKKTIGWEFGEIECVLEFWSLFSDALPEEIRCLFKVDSIEHHYRKSDNILIKSISQQSNMILVSPSPKFLSIGDFLKNDFIDEDAENFVIHSEDQQEYSHVLDGRTIEENEEIPSKTTVSISSKPKILVFGVKRLYWNSETNSVEFNHHRLIFPKSLTIDGEEYTSMGGVLYDQGRIHYLGLNLDPFSDQVYLHDDHIVRMFKETDPEYLKMARNFALNNCLVFYVKNNSLEEYRADPSKLNISQELVEFLTSRSVKSTGKAQKREVEENETTAGKMKKRRTETEESKEASEEFKQANEKVSRIVSPSRARKSYKKKTTFIKPLRQTKISNAEKSQAEEEVVKSPVKSARILADSFIDFKLGSLPFLFMGNRRNAVLETFLIAISRNPGAVRNLFEMTKDKPKQDIQFKIALMILRILIGRMDIDVSELSEELMTTYEIDFMFFSSAWTKLSQLLPKEISPIPDLKLIRYNFDEPVEMLEIQECDHFSIKPFKTLPVPMELKFSGPTVDFQEEPFPTGEVRRRCILKTSGIILPLAITRLIHSEGKKPAYDANVVNFHDGEHIAYGCIGTIPEFQTVFAIFLDNESNEKLYFYKRGIAHSVKIDANIAGLFTRLFRRQSNLIFMTRYEHFNQEIPMLSQIPKVFIDALNAETLN